MLKIRVFGRIPHLARHVSKARSRVTRTLNFKLLNFFFELEAGELLNCVTLNFTNSAIFQTCVTLLREALEYFLYRNPSFFEWISIKICRNFTKILKFFAL